MNPFDWLRARLRDDAAHAALDRREADVEGKIRDLRIERSRNGFGALFDTAVHPYKPPHRPREIR